ncbi:M90 family metallopeptidase [Actibacterium pelagium]|uniref:Mlc titration factor A n=1 Tax=Actibacterium pelagium TaxID=2029103 RepID=A0A917AFM6_9RHOB|nr:M90 family metallopeptidase [Actibacterium pelagium]GGE47325.1 hypothetical protein GCM10011517_13880 [Actibacterium pelagium]
MVWFLIALAAVAGLFVYRVWSKRQRRAALLAAPLSAEEREIVFQQVPLLERLPQEFHSKLEGKINLFLDQVEFYGCDGLDLTEEMQLSIAAQACLIVVNSDQWYKHLRTILVYPGAFKSKQTYQDGFVVSEKETYRLGESWQHGPIVLSWPHSEQGALNDLDGHNLVFHEFAHQLDGLSGYTDGAPLLDRGHRFEEWAKVFSNRFKAHVEDVKHGHKTFLDPYGAEGPEEFFAVAMEVFFEKPQKLQREEPQVYEQLTKLLNLKPAEWPAD